jgi:hypothetical protein
MLSRSCHCNLCLLIQLGRLVVGLDAIRGVDRSALNTMPTGNCRVGQRTDGFHLAILILVFFVLLFFFLLLFLSACEWADSCDEQEQEETFLRRYRTLFFCSHSPLLFLLLLTNETTEN